MPHAIFNSPAIAGVAKTEQELRSTGISYKKSIYRYIDIATGLTINDEEGFVKLLVSIERGDYVKILGCHSIGQEASMNIH